MTPYYQDDAVTIYHGDCREVGLSSESVDLILTDPPYGVDYVTSWRSHTDSLRTPIANDGNTDCYGVLAEMVGRVLREDRHWYAFASPRALVAAQTALRPKQVLVWDKGDRGTVGDLAAGFGEAWEAVLYGMRGRRHLNGPRPRSVIRMDWSGTLDPVHPTVKPVDLLRRCIGWSTDEDEVVLDPFMGSGTTLRAAKDLGRKAIGIEIEERYCEIAAKRCAQEVLAI